ncbi:MAG TPA: alpha/beta fold hydrolase [Sphingomonadaceae bacterium]|nr:alpha/beta fold hydrolase [Sphingomonadaceae bacterium]
MAALPADLPIRTFAAEDGVRLAWRETGPADGWPVVLLHGLFSDGYTNWVRYGHAARLAARGLRVILPDLRGHGASGRPHDPAAYPPDILARDGAALIAHLGLRDFDLGGYSLGARTAVRMLIAGLRPRRAAIAGMGREGLLDTGRRARHFRAILQGIGTHRQGSPEWMAEAFLKTTGGDPQALLPLLDSFVDTPEAALRVLATPCLVVIGAEDGDNGSAAELAALLPDARLETIPGNHMSAVTKPDLGDALAAFFGG